jgi:hypothetical protein
MRTDCWRTTVKASSNSRAWSSTGGGGDDDIMGGGETISERPNSHIDQGFIIRMSCGALHE